MSYELKCKAIALQAEAQAFKKQEARSLRLAKKWEGRAKTGRAKAERLIAEGIRHHRITTIRREARRNNLARGFLNGLKYQEVERFAWTQPNWDKVLKSAIAYSGLSEQVVTQRFAQWVDEALNGVEAKIPPKTLVPGSVKNSMYDMDWVNMQLHRNAGEQWVGPGSAMIVFSDHEDGKKVSLLQRTINLFGDRRPQKKNTTI